MTYERIKSPRRDKTDYPLYRLSLVDSAAALRCLVRP